MLSTMDLLEAGSGASAAGAAAAAAAPAAVKPDQSAASWQEYCRICDDNTCVSQVLMPYVFRYLANELAGMGIRLTLEVDRL
jgi:DNA-directed RNA polymerase beta subunit